MIERHRYDSMQALSVAFADFAASILRQALSCYPAVTLVVPGGLTPREYLPELSQQSLPWENVYITLSDERWVATQADASNEQLVRNHLLINKAEKASFIGLKTPHAQPAEAVAAVHERLALLPFPFSLTVLGLGEDGHVASLFPGTILDPGTSYLCQAVTPPVAPGPRISLTLAALANSRQIAFVVTGAAKRKLLDQLIESPDPAVPFVQLSQRCLSPISIFETT